MAGILTELSAEPERVHFVVLGIGVNLNAQPERLPRGAGARRPPRCAQAPGQQVPRALFTAALWTRLEEWLDLHADDGLRADPATPGRQLSSTLGQEVLVRTERQEFRGLAEDIDDGGRAAGAHRRGPGGAGAGRRRGAGCAPSARRRFARSAAAGARVRVRCCSPSTSATPTPCWGLRRQEAAGPLAAGDQRPPHLRRVRDPACASCSRWSRHRSRDKSTAVAVSSVVPPLQFNLERMSERYFKAQAACSWAPA